MKRLIFILLIIFGCMSCEKNESDISYKNESNTNINNAQSIKSLTLEQYNIADKIKMYRVNFSEKSSFNNNPSQLYERFMNEYNKININ